MTDAASANQRASWLRAAAQARGFWRVDDVLAFVPPGHHPDMNTPEQAAQQVAELADPRRTC